MRCRASQRPSILSELAIGGRGECHRERSMKNCGRSSGSQQDLKGWYPRMTDLQSSHTCRRHVRKHIKVHLRTKVGVYHDRRGWVRYDQQRQDQVRTWPRGILLALYSSVSEPTHSDLCRALRYSGRGQTLRYPMSRELQVVLASQHFISSTASTSRKEVSGGYCTPLCNSMALVKGADASFGTR